MNACFLLQPKNYRSPLLPRAVNPPILRLRRLGVYSFRFDTSRTYGS